MSVKVVNPGMMTTVQDLGRWGFQKFGMPVCGVCDARSAKIANILVGNKLDEAVIECTIMGPALQFGEDEVIAVTGGNLTPMVNGAKIPTGTAVAVKAGDTLSFGMPVSGCRAYIAFAGGLDIKEIMGSKSTCLKAKVGGFEGRKLGRDDEIKLLAPVAELPNMNRRSISCDFGKRDVYEVHVIPGPQDDAFTAKGTETFYSETYTVSGEFDRMGIRCEGAAVEHKDGADILSDGIAFGSVQIPGNGQPIIMMADHQTTGGYTKIGTVITYDTSTLGQLKAGDKIKFVKYSVEKAQDLVKTEKDALKCLQRVCESAY